MKKKSEKQATKGVRGKHAARVVSVHKVKGKRQPGSLKGKLRVGPEFFEPLPVSWQ